MSGRPRSSRTSAGRPLRRQPQPLRRRVRPQRLVAGGLQRGAEEAVDLRLVVHDEHARRRPETLMPGNLHRDARPAPVRRDRALGRDPPAHGVGQSAADRQAEPRPGGDPVGAAGAEERVEDPVQVGGRDAGSVVLDSDRHLVALAPRPHRHLTGRPRELQRVVEQVAEDLVEQGGIEQRLRQPLRQLAPDAPPAARSARRARRPPRSPRRGRPARASARSGRSRCARCRGCWRCSG